MEVHAEWDWGHGINKAGEAELQYMCDLCDERTPLESIRRTEEHVYLCPNCYGAISAMPGGKIKASVIRFLTRNVI